jgi:hypothetical protein
MDGVEHSRSRAPHAMTEINFGLHSAGRGHLGIGLGLLLLVDLHSAGRGHLVRHGSPRQGSTYLRTAINSQSSSLSGVGEAEFTPARACMPALMTRIPAGAGLNASARCSKDVCLPV